MKFDLFLNSKTILIPIILSFLGFKGLSQSSRGTKPIKANVKGETIELYSGSYALLVGNSDYRYWSKLPGVKTDIIEIKKALEKHNFKVITEENLDKVNLDKAFSRFIRRYGNDKNHRLLFYFAGHGYTINSSYGEQFGYIVPIDASNPIGENKSAFKDTSIPMSRIIEYAKSIESKHALFLFDACFSGNLINSRGAGKISESIKYSSKLPIRYFITSGSADEAVPDRSVFREEFVTALTSNRADLTNDGFITDEELGIFLYNNVTNYTYGQQHPQKGPIRNNKLDKGHFVFKLPSTSHSSKKFEKPRIKESEENSITLLKMSEDEKEELRKYSMGIQFISGSTEVSNSSIEKLIEIANTLRNYPNLKFIIEGHTDSQGNASDNQLLSERRAEAIKDYLTRLGINSKNLKAIGYGEGKPIASNKIKSGRAENRRIEIRLAKTH